MPRRTSPPVGFGFSREQRDRRQDLARRAEAALQRVVLDERRLHADAARRRAPSPSIVVIALSVAGRGEREAGIRRDAVDQHGARAALAAAADELRAGEVEPLAQGR